MSNLATLQPFKKGKGENRDPRINATGLNKGSVSITTAIKNELAKIPDGQKKTYLELLVARIMKKAVQDGDHAMIKDVWNYVDGLPKGSLELSGVDGKDLFDSTEEIKILTKQINEIYRTANRGGDGTFADPLGEEAQDTE